MKQEDHLRAYEEHREVINWAIDRGLPRSQRIIGTHASRAIIELLSAYLHKINKIDIGFQINHRWFKSERVSEKLPEFSKKSIIVKKMVELENLCESLTYGTQKSENEITKTLEILNDLEKILKEELK